MDGGSSGWTSEDGCIFVTYQRTLRPAGDCLTETWNTSVPRTCYGRLVAIMKRYAVPRRFVRFMSHSQALDVTM